MGEERQGRRGGKGGKRGKGGKGEKGEKGEKKKKPPNKYTLFQQHPEVKRRAEATGNDTFGTRSKYVSAMWLECKEHYNGVVEDWCNG